MFNLFRFSSKHSGFMKIFITSVILFISTQFSAQVITTPEFPTENGTVEITFNLNEMTNQSLIGYTGTLYTHTGINTDLGDWQHVIGSWGDNADQPTLTRIGTDIYTLTINNPRDYYNVSNSSEHILSLNFVLRSSDGTQQSEDLFIPIYEQGFNIKLLDLESINFYPLPGEQIDITIVTNGADSLKVFLNNELISQSTTDTLSFSFIPEQTGRQWLKYIAKGNGDVYQDSVSFFIREHLTIEELPEGIKPGINYLDNNSVTLALYAPNKNFVYAIGDFNNWEFDQSASLTWDFDEKYYFNLTPDSTIYWITLENLTSNNEYRFQYLVDGNLRIADPYGDKILSEEDSHINDATYPNLIPYPTGKTFFSVSVFETGQQDFAWEAVNYVKPEKENLIIYELLIRDFLSSHNYKTLIDTLDYLDNLGINAIELMPINEFEGNESWGYNPSFYFAPDKYYGTKNDLKKFIDECHKRNIAVISDMVLNHSYGRSPFVRLYASDNFGPPTEENPWYNVNSPNQVFSWGYDFNHESEQTKLLVDRINRYWIEEYKFDGFRFDFTKGFTNKPGDGWAYDASRISLLKRMSDSIWSVDSTSYVIFEHLSENSEEKELADYGIMLWGKMTDPYNEATMGYNESGKSDLSWGYYENRGWLEPNLVTYMESHDEERLMVKNLLWGNSSDSYSVKDLNTALSRMKIASAFFYTIPGPKMLWQFGELGFDYSINWPSGESKDRLTKKPLVWNYLENTDRLNLYKTIQALIKLRLENEVFRSENVILNLSGDVKRIKITDESMNVVIIGNFNVVEKSIIPSFHNEGMWYDYFSGDSIEVTNTQLSVTLSPGEFHIYTTIKLQTPESDILVNVEKNNDNTIPIVFKLFQNYPNPFNPTTTISYSIPSINIDGRLENVKLKVFDILGNEVATLVEEQQSAGNYKINFDASFLPSGIYFYRIQAGSFIETKKLVLLK